MGKKNRKTRTLKKVSDPIKYDSNLDLNLALNTIAEKRTGGAVNIRGIGFQLSYACNKIVKELSSNDVGKSIRLEGIEDIDVIHIDNNEYFQLKSSINNLDAFTFWKLRIMQNFLDAYKANPNVKLYLIHNSNISKGKLSDLSNRNISEEILNFWKEKFTKASIEISDIDFEMFLKTIHFVKVSETNLINETLSLLTKRFSLNNGTEQQYLKALFYNVFNWSKERVEVSFKDLNKVIQTVTDSFSKGPINPAIQNNWINPVDFDFQNIVQDLGYFDGKSARPEHIIWNLPVPRKEWEKKIGDSLQNYSVTVIKSSSGQGKSTLAWKSAKLLLDKGFSIYELNYCHKWENVAGIKDFLESRLKIGQLPVIVIDGLNSNLAGWKDLASQLAYLPIKLLVTTREEDWYRYGLDASKTSLKIIDIQLSINEAKEIYHQLKKQDKIHASVSSWQPVWERIKGRGLLIEYIYLLTRGQMIRDRINEQIKEVNTEQDAAAKLEILRLVALADVLNISIKTRKLTKHIQENIRFKGDRGEVYKQLELEYYIRLDQQFVEGLHAVRSHHLLDVLHQTIQVEDTMISLFPLIDEKFIYDYFISVSEHVSEVERKEFYDQLAKLISSHKFSEMVYAIDGLMHGETRTYWINNKEIFDQVAENGALELFLMETLPFTKLNIFNSLEESFGDKATNIDFLSEKRNELKKYDYSNSELILFIKCLSKYLGKSDYFPEKFEGIGFLAQWFHQLGVPFTMKLEYSENELLSILRTKNINEVAEIFKYLAICSSSMHENFINSNKQEVLSFLKKGTNSLTIEEHNNDINIEYLLDNDVDKANEYSVYRINMVYSFLPFYEKYCTKAIMLPFPNEEMYKIVLQNSIKEMPAANIANIFDVHINQIWNRTILYNYSASSTYEWQEQQILLRKQGVEFSKKCTRYFEAQIEGNNSRIRSSSNPLIDQTKRLLMIIRKKKKYPNYSLKYFENEEFKSEQRLINSWCTSMNNFCNQFVSIIEPKSSNDRNLAIVNLRSALSELLGMQEAYQQIVSEYSYFDFEQLEMNEQMWHERLLKTVSYYVYQIENSIRLAPVAKIFIERWWDNARSQILNSTHSVINSFEAESYYDFYLPNKIIEEGILTKVVIGVDHIDIQNIEDETLYLLSGLVELAKVEVDYFIFINILNSEAIGAFSVPREFFNRVQKLLDTGEVEETEYGNPYPVNIDQSLLSSIDGITEKDVKEKAFNLGFGKIMFAIWKLSEYRNRLDIKNDIEKEWLQEIEKEYCQEIIVEKDQALQALEPTEISECKDLLNRVIDQKYIATKDDVLKLLNYRLDRISERIFYG
ncbi:MAG: hypothetical protein HRT73_06875 [Flavobacteriales bacterium]|nr:hypothetical protein [Flavobacteriales bacterium]